MTELGGLPGATNSMAYGINDSGQVVGDSDSSTGHPAFLYSNGTTTGFGNLDIAAYGINASGQVVRITGTSGGSAHACLYSQGTLTDLGTLPGGTDSCVTGINASGEVMGKLRHGHQRRLPNTTALT